MQNHKIKYTNLNDSDGIKCFSFVKGRLTLYSWVRVYLEMNKFVQNILKIPLRNCWAFYHHWGFIAVNWFLYQGPTLAQSTERKAKLRLLSVDQWQSDVKIAEEALKASLSVAF